jgi:hypothetical protein
MVAEAKKHGVVEEEEDIQDLLNDNADIFTNNEFGEDEIQGDMPFDPMADGKVQNYETENLKGNNNGY